LPEHFYIDFARFKIRISPTNIIEKFLFFCFIVDPGGLYIGKYPPPPPGGEISAVVIWGGKYEKAKRKGRKT
jgi:hypothetical protein